MTVLIGFRYSDSSVARTTPRPVNLRRLALIWQFQSSRLVMGPQSRMLYGPKHTQRIKLAYLSDWNRQSEQDVTKREKKLVGCNPGGFLSRQHWTAEQNEWIAMKNQSDKNPKNWDTLQPSFGLPDPNCSAHNY